MLVVDASVVVKWVTEEDGSDAATELLNMELAAPDLWLPRRRTRSGRSSAGA